MEVSSHALAQSRLTGMEFDIGVFTNLSRDHLDFHTDMQQYFTSKKLLFTNYIKDGGRIVIVLDDSESKFDGDKTAHEKRNNWGKQMYAELKALFQAKEDFSPIITCGMGSDCDIYPHNFSIDINGIKTEITTPAGSMSLKTPLVGEFNLRNMLCAIGIGITHGEKLDCLQNGLEEIKTIPGRLERIGLDIINNGCPAVFVDYAHTPDALENVLDALLKLNPKRLVCVFGCGGDRDTGKRFLMGEIAGKLCDVVLATSDNPRSESPEAILAQIEKGLIKTGAQKVSASNTLSKKDGRGYDIIVNRRQAINTAIKFAGPEDVILISGKGHENYQISSKGKIFFDDRVEAEMRLQAQSGTTSAWKLE
jgi:UDP-N-acetylmuramyl-tripeptide synthetase